MSNLGEGIALLSETIIGAILVVVVNLISVAAIPLTFIFLILKLIGIISWGWFFIFIPLIVWGITLFVVCLIALIAALIDN